ncbi:MAG: 6-hydroxycyclohex-1-ene-1-carbonyl-CoA dehydrogenase [Acidobacteriota bacterium]|nr:6-hydroxycyclohex-1-ene-1-carbonyl-CoA dehydrogenase [Acidobacteriota bacterium]MDQ7088015.1 6-hydroxycyclohex-1-ene-1-carbonyl-CoA dehydrogenase [Acidobacteriota bacterium]
MSGKKTMQAWMMMAQEKPFEKRERPLEEPGAGEVVVEVAGCGVCHTDLSFLYHGVQTRAELPLTLGHEISGTVDAAGPGVEGLPAGAPVVVPAVLSCGECELCRAGQRRICRKQIMPGNDRHGGYASHVTVPARYVCPVSEKVLSRAELWQLAVVSDAVTTPFQAVRRSGLARGDLAVFIGAGGIGIHGVQIAAAVGATVIALDVDAAKLETARRSGAAAVIDVSGLSVKEIRKAVREEAKKLGAPGHLWKIYETSGTRPGQETAFSLLGFGATLAVVGFTMARLELRLSNLMAFDATAFGNWGCDPELYPEVLDWVGEGKIQLDPFVERRSLDEINEVFRAAHAGELTRRVVLVP